jgi:hypothetical protein
VPRNLTPEMMLDWSDSCTCSRAGCTQGWTANATGNRPIEVPSSSLSSCQQIVSIDPTRGLASHHGALSRSLPEQDRRDADRGYGGPREVVWMAWHARGQGFKSPQLHQAQRIFSLHSERRLPAICQQMTQCGRTNAVSIARVADRGQPPPSPARLPGAPRARPPPGRPSPGWCAGSGPRWHWPDAVRPARWPGGPSPRR